MAKRPVFIISDRPPYYKECLVEFTYHSGFSEVQKRKSIKSLHEAFTITDPGYSIIEISSKSDNPIGIKLSAFNLAIKTKSLKEFSVESAFQASKVFQNGGPYKDILGKSSKEAKRDERLKSSGKLIYFDYFGRIFSLNPPTYFYNWLYINSLKCKDYYISEVMKYNAFTDIEFNPDKSINCQAIAVAVFVSLSKLNLLDKALESQESFLDTVYGKNITPSDYTEQINLWD